MDDLLRETIESYAKNKLTEHQMIDRFQRLNLEESFAVRERYIKHFSTNRQQIISYRNDQESAIQLWNTFDGPAELIDVTQMINSFPLSSNLFMFFDYDYRNQAMYKLGREYVFRLTSDQFIANVTRLPPDTYIFDDSFEKSLVLTHEEFNYADQNIILIASSFNLSTP